MELLVAGRTCSLQQGPDFGGSRAGFEILQCRTTGPANGACLARFRVHTVQNCYCANATTPTNATDNVIDALDVGIPSTNTLSRWENRQATLPQPRHRTSAATCLLTTPTTTTTTLSIKRHRFGAHPAGGPLQRLRARARQLPASIARLLVVASRRQQLSQHPAH